MALNIDDIRIEEKRFSILQEIRDFAIIFIVIVCFGWLFINAQLLVIIVDDIVNKTSVSANDITLSSPKKTINIASVEKKEKKKNWDDMSKLKKRLLKKKLSEKLSNIWFWDRTDMIYKPSYESVVKKNLKSYSMNFNTLPPDNRLKIPAIWVNVNVLTLTNIPIKTIEKADYDSYLYKWVIKYPYTWTPGNKWNVFIFGHTSYYWWKKNPYGSVFAKIPQLKHGDIMQLTRHWKIYKYKIFKKFIQHPSQVDYVYKKYQDGQYLTIMWCYPIWTDRDRMVIVAKRE